jgi:hypothetical protein
MGATLKDFAKSLVDLIKDKIRLRAVAKKDIVKDISLTKSTLEITANTLAELQIDRTDDMVIRFSKICQANKLPDHYNLFIGRCGRPTKDVEVGKPFESIIRACKTSAAILEAILKNIDKYIETNDITIFKCHMSHAAIFGMIKNSNILANYSSYMLGYFIAVLDNENANNIAKYRLEYLKEKNQDFANVVSQLNERRSIYNFIKDVDVLRKSANDAILFANGNPIIDTLNPNRLAQGVRDSVTMGFMYLNIFAMLKERYDLWQHAKYRKLEDERDAMKNRVAMLKMQMDDIPKSSTEYQRQMQIVQNYEEMINKHDRQINEYFEDK